MSESGSFFSHRGECEFLAGAAEEGLACGVEVPECARVCVFGVDACSIAGEILSDAADEASPVPLTSVRDGRVPGWVDADTLAVLISYEGDCPEVLGIIPELRSRGCPVIGITSGGPLVNELGPSELLMVPSDLDVAEATGYTLGMLAAAVQSAGQFGSADMLSDAIAAVRGACGEIREEASRLAGELRGGVCAFYSTSDVHSCAVAFREAVSGRAGVLSFAGELPEFDHNELVGWSDPNVHAPDLRMVVLRGDSDSDLVNRIVACMTEVLETNGRSVVQADIGGGCAMARDVRGLMLALETSALLGVRG